VAIAGKWARSKARQRTGCRSGVPWPGQALGVLAIQRLPPAWPVLAVLDHRQFGRAFVLSIGEAGHEATTAPVSSGAWWRSPASGPGRRRDSAPAADRACRGLVRVSGSVAIRGCRWRGPCWQRSITGSSVGPSSSRSVKPATKRRRRQRRAVPGGDRRQVGQVEGETAHRLPIGRCRGVGRSRGAAAGVAVLDHRQFGRAFVLSIGEAGHEATTAPASSGAGGDRRQVGQGEGETAHRLPIGRAVAWSGLGVRAIGRGCRWRGPCWQRSITGSSVGLRPLDR
jgi:hypothetical protein